MDEFPASWSLVKRSLPPLVAYAAGRLHSAWRAGQRAQAAISRDSDTPVTWQGERMRTSYPRRSNRRRRRPTRVPRMVVNRSYQGRDVVKRFVRPTASSEITMTTGTVYGSMTPTLDQVYILDLANAYRLYRIRKVVFHLVPRVDPANSGTVNNFQCQIVAACDNEDSSPVNSWSQLAASDNSYYKWLTATDRFKYTFYPKAVNAIQSGTGASIGLSSYSTNPWIFFNSTGTAVPHYSLKYGIKAGAATTLKFDFFLEYHFDLKGLV